MWQGVIINGAIRDSAAVAKLPIGCKALGTMPLKSEKKVPGTFSLESRRHSCHIRGLRQSGHRTACIIPA